ncbi:MAG: hypothetical protein NTY19_28115 [Planctomycetota bacterium]|nr:hypothetical protein [Planctomycetota bacterium]
MTQLRQWLSAVALLAGLSTASGAEPERSAIIKLAVHDRDQAGQLRTLQRTGR